MNIGFSIFAKDKYELVICNNLPMSQCQKTVLFYIAKWIINIYITTIFQCQWSYFKYNDIYCVFNIVYRLYFPNLCSF